MQYHRLENQSRAQVVKQKTREFAEKFSRNEHDVGSTEVQVARLTAKIAYMSEHLKVHRKDISARRVRSEELYRQARWNTGSRTYIIMCVE